MQGLGEGFVWSYDLMSSSNAVEGLSAFGDGTGQKVSCSHVSCVSSWVTTALVSGWSERPSQIVSWMRSKGQGVVGCAGAAPVMRCLEVVAALS